MLSKTNEAHFSNRQKVVYEELWHQRPGHPQTYVIKLLHSKHLIHICSRKKNQTLCESLIFSNFFAN